MSFFIGAALFQFHGTRKVKLLVAIGGEGSADIVRTLEGGLARGVLVVYKRVGGSKRTKKGK